MENQTNGTENGKWHGKQKCVILVSNNNNSNNNISNNTNTSNSNIIKVVCYLCRLSVSELCAPAGTHKGYT